MTATPWFPIRIATVSGGERRGFGRSIGGELRAMVCPMGHGWRSAHRVSGGEWNERGADDCIGAARTANAGLRLGDRTVVVDDAEPAIAAARAIEEDPTCP